MKGLPRLPRLPAVCLLLVLSSATPAQQMIWTDTFNGGVVTGTFSIGDQGNGIGVIWMQLPPGATVRKALLYVTNVGGSPADSLHFPFGGIPVSLGPGTAGPAFGTLYGPNVLHTVDLTAQLDPTVPYHVVDVSGNYTNFKEYMLVTEYELPGMGPITLDIFHLGEDSQLEENYTIHTSHPMSSGAPIAFGTMGAYARSWIYDYEAISVNGNVLGTFYGADYNAGAGNHYGACATFHYANGVFEGIGDDSTDVAIHGADVLSNLASLVSDGTQTLQLTYAHNPTLDPGQQQDNIVNLALLAYSATPCDNATQPLGPDTTLCPGDTLVLDATRSGATYLWQDGSTAPTFTVTAPGTYMVHWAHPECSWAPDTVTVAMVALPDPALGPDRELCTGATAVLGPQPGPGVVFSWADGNLDLPRTVDSTGTYKLRLTLTGCSRTDSVHLAVVDCASTLEMPNVFTPNGDGSNALFRPLDVHGVAHYSLVVYNRWGQELFRSDKPMMGWDGRTPAGTPAPEGVYFWVLEYSAVREPGTMVPGHGTVTLLR